MIRLAINGFGRIGRMAARVVQQHEGIELVAINDLADIKTLGYLFKYDSVHGGFDGTLEVLSDGLLINGIKTQLFSQKSPKDLPWKELNIDVVIEATGFFRKREDANQHIEAGAKKVIISAPASSDDITTVVIGINDEVVKDQTILSNASCTTNSLAPLVKILDELCEIESGYITTIHSYTGDQRLLDAPHKDLRRARAAAVSIVPTSTGAAKAITKIFPRLEGQLGGAGVRVPVPDGSLTDFTCVVKNPKSIEAINAAFKLASETHLKGILEYTEEPIVSIDIVGSPYSCVFDAQLTSVIGNLVKVVGWYDNEMGYSNRIIELVKRIG
jgi:glyceraldehyde 3-phosphate dehydrogenase